MRYCYLFNVVYFLICTLKNCKNKRIFVSNTNVLPGPGRGRGDWPLAACRPSSRTHGTKYGTRYTFGIVKSASNKIDKLAACCKYRSFEYRERCIDDRDFVIGRNTRMTIVLLESDGRIQFLTPEAEVRTLPGY